jgi:tRNA U34 5-methylaminomethyl-2-thiouridine-forming methyltransferase MnmC
VKREIIITHDGSKTIHIPDLNENYHSGHGALQEAVHVFIENGLKSLESEHVSVFEMGFGTGLNAYLAMIFADESHKMIHYTGVEAFPLQTELISQLDYPELVNRKLESAFLKMHELEWGSAHQITRHFCFTKLHQKIEDFTPGKEAFDLVFYDAFGPRAQEEMWKTDILHKMWYLLKSGGVLVTYCARGQFRRDLISLGFEVDRLPGPPGKREMIRAVKR